MVKIAIPTATPIPVKIATEGRGAISKIPKVTIPITITVPRVSISVTEITAAAVTSAPTNVMASGRVVNQSLGTARGLATQRWRNRIIRATRTRRRSTVTEALGGTVPGIEPR